MQAANASTIDQIWRITKAIEHAAAVGEWERAAQLAGERSPLLMSLPSALPPATLDTLRNVQAVDAAVAQAAQNAQHALNAEYRAAMQATSNAGAYQTVAQY